MKSFLAAVARFMRSTPKFVMQRILVAGELISRLIAVPAEPIADAGTSPAAEAQAAVDEHTAAVRSIAGHLLNRQIPSPDLSGKITEMEFDWLLACTPSMLQAIVAAEDRALRDHIRGKQSIKGVLVNDAKTVVEFVADAVEQDGQEMKSAWMPALAR